MKNPAVTDVLVSSIHVDAAKGVDVHRATRHAVALCVLKEVDVVLTFNGTEYLISFKDVMDATRQDGRKVEE